MSFVVYQATCPMQVKYADGEVERLEHKLFVGMLPKNVSESEVSDLFSQYGTIKDQLILRGSQQTSKGCAFVKYETKEQALAAIDGLNGKHKMEGSTVPLVVKWADTERERLARKAQKATIWAASNFANADMTHPSLFGALPMGYISPYNNYGYQVCWLNTSKHILGGVLCVVRNHYGYGFDNRSYGNRPDNGLDV
ncbi:putative RNA recognition motif domain, paraneoplastic encephalomyelitis antigen [Helianthus annuus]|nr:putative RNA recognition motif domain, paraneoplastic encephalomyelitis antigen [Helianthus annuus]